MNSTYLTEAIDKRIALYKEANNGVLPNVLINVGGNHGKQIPKKEDNCGKEINATRDIYDYTLGRIV